MNLRPRMPTQYSLHRTSTGRMSSGTADDDPEKKRKQQQLQNVPRKLRDAIVPDPGYIMVGGDWSGIDWCIAMWLFAKYKPDGPYMELLERAQRGELDAHRYLASFAFDVVEDQVTSKQRKTCKPYTHGRTFGGSPNGLAAEVGHPQRVGQLVCRAHDRAFQTEEPRNRIYEEAKRKHYVQTPLGWRKYFWDWKPKHQEVIGILVQAIATGDLLKWTYLRLCQQPLVGFELLTCTHDSFLGQILIDRGEEARHWLKGQMEQPVPWLDNRTWRADVKTGYSWKEVS